MRPDLKEIATTVAQDPTTYKLCMVCGALVDRHADSCPDCMAYRFDEDVEHVMNRAIDLGSRPQQAVTHLDKLD